MPTLQIPTRSSESSHRRLRAGQRICDAGHEDRDLSRNAWPRSRVPALRICHLRPVRPLGRCDRENIASGREYCSSIFAAPVIERESRSDASRRMGGRRRCPQSSASPAYKRDAIFPEFAAL